MDKMRDLLLYVDDEDQALKYFRMAFDRDYEVLIATDAEQAWSLIEQHADRLAVIISDQRMPGRTGVELLTAAKERCPRAMRMLTTAYSDLSSAISAVNRGEIYAYVTKPWVIDGLRVVVRQALQVYHLQRERDALLAEKLSVFQHLLLADRTRVLGVAMATLAGQVRRPLAAAAAWLRDRQGAFVIAHHHLDERRDLWLAVLEQSKVAATIAGELGLWLAHNRSPETTADVVAAIAEAVVEYPDAKMVSRVADAAMTFVEPVAGLLGSAMANHAELPLAIDSRLLSAGFSQLFHFVRSQLESPAGEAVIRIRNSKGGSILDLRLHGSNEPEPDPDFSALAAYLTIYHHRGSITVPRWSATGGEIEIVLGGSDDDGMAAFIAGLAFIER